MSGLRGPAEQVTFPVRGGAVFGVALAALWLGGCSCQNTTVVPSHDGVAPPVETGGTALAPVLRKRTQPLTEGVVAGLPDYRAPGNSRIDLTRTAARYTLPKVTLPPKVAAITEEFVLVGKEMPNPNGTARAMTVVQAPLPFPVSKDETTFKPEGMTVLVGGEEIPFSRGPAHQARKPTWRISKNGKLLVLSLPAVPAPDDIVVRSPEVVRTLERHDPDRSGLTVDDFLRKSVTIGGETRSGLLLVAPTTLDWDLTVPPLNPMFEAWTTLEAPPIDRPRSDGVTFVLSARADGKETILDRRELRDATAFERWRVDLSAYAGRAVTLRLASETNATAVFDWAFLGSPEVVGQPEGDVRRVVIVALDTTRPDHFSYFGYGRDTTPELDTAFRQAFTFQSAWSTAPRTRPSFRSSTTGRLPLEAVGATNIGEVFHDHGFATAGIVANVHLQPRFHFDDGFDSWTYDGTANAKVQVERGLEWLRDNADRDSYLFLHFMDPHMAYDAPEPWRSRYVPNPTLPRKVSREEVLDWMRDGTLTAGQREELEGLHDGELAYTSAQLGTFFGELDRLPGRTLVVVHSDHGEEFWEHDGFEHNHSLYDELVRTVLAFRPGDGLSVGHRLEAPVSLMDVAPTLYDLFGFDDAPETDGRSLVSVLSGGEAPERPLPVGYLQYSHERWGVVWNGRKYIVHTGTGREELYDLEKDPDETVDLAATEDLAPYQAQLHAAHGIDIGPGLRIAVTLEPESAPITVELPAVARRADVLDPESVVEKRANVEWGETPRKFPVQVGKVTLAPDGRSFTFEPGTVGQGLLYVLFDAPVDPAAVKVSRDGAILAHDDGRSPRSAPCEAQPGQDRLCIDAGTVVVPPVTEAARMGLAGAPPPAPKASADDGTLEELCLLGYVTEGCEKFQKPRSDDDPPTDEAADGEATE